MICEERKGSEEKGRRRGKKYNFDHLIQLLDKFTCKRRKREKLGKRQRDREIEIKRER